MTSTILFHYRDKLVLIHLLISELFSISIIVFMDIKNSNYGYPKCELWISKIHNYGYKKMNYVYWKMNHGLYNSELCISMIQILDILKLWGANRDFIEYLWISISWISKVEFDVTCGVPEQLLLTDWSTRAGAKLRVQRIHHIWLDAHKTNNVDTPWSSP